MSLEVSPDATTAKIDVHTPENAHTPEEFISVKQERTDNLPNITSLNRINVSPSADMRIKVENIHDEQYSNVDREYSSLVQEEPEDLSMKSSHNTVVTELNFNEDSYHHSHHISSSIRCGVLQRTEPLS